MGSDKKGFLTGLTCRTNWTGLKLSEENEKYKKWVGRIFDEKRV